MTDVQLDPTSLARAHARSYHSFTLLLKWGLLHLAVILVFLVTTFCTPAGWGLGLFFAILVAAIGIWALTHGLNHSSEAGSLEQP